MADEEHALESEGRRGVMKLKTFHVMQGNAAGAQAEQVDIMPGYG